MKKYVITILILTLFLTPSACLAAIKYIRSGATGNNDGSDWNNAYISFAAAGLHNTDSSIPRGNTYYVGNGSYGAPLLRNNTSGTAYITIKKATASDHGTDTGWSAAYANQATFTGLNFRDSYITFDGSVGSGSNPADYGFKITNTAAKDVRLVGIPPLGGHNDKVNYINLSHSALITRGSAGDYVAYPIYGNPYIHGGKHITISYCYLTGGSTNILFRKWSDSVIEYSYFDGNWSSSKNHGQQISPGNGSDDIILRGNTFVDSYIFVVGAHTSPKSSPGNYRWKIYNNIVIDGGNFMSAVWASADSAHSNVVGSWQVHHNTYIGGDYSSRGIVFQGNDGGDGTSYAYNNLFYNVKSPKFSGGVVNDYNVFYNCSGEIGDEPNIEIANGDPFVSISQNDFRLLNPTISGKILSAPFDIDIVGISRGADGIWNVGAFEYDGDATSLTPPPSPPSNLRVVTPN